LHIQVIGPTRCNGDGKGGLAAQGEALPAYAERGDLDRSRTACTEGNCGVCSLADSYIAECNCGRRRGKSSGRVLDGDTPAASGYGQEKVAGKDQQRDCVQMVVVDGQGAATNSAWLCSRAMAPWRWDALSKCGKCKPCEPGICPQLRLLEPLNSLQPSHPPSAVFNKRIR
jgi:hypothetical protein